MKAIKFQEKGQTLEVTEVSSLSTASGTALVNMTASEPNQSSLTTASGTALVNMTASEPNQSSLTTASGTALVNMTASEPNQSSLTTASGTALVNMTASEPNQSSLTTASGTALVNMTASEPNQSSLTTASGTALVNMTANEPNQSSLTTASGTALVNMTANQTTAPRTATASPGINQSNAAGTVLVNLKAAALNHRDVWISKGMYPGLKAGVTLGSDGAGEVGGRKVIINPSWNWGDNQSFPSKEYQILGMPTDGTFAEQILVPKDRLADMPKHLNFEQAAALPLGGLTAYRVLFSRCRLQKGERVLISGIGGGVALFACQFALAAGAEVWVTSSSRAKIAKALKMGAKGGANYTKEGWAKTFGKKVGQFDVIVDSAGGPGFADLVKLAAPGARIGLYGGTKGAWEGVSPQLIFYRQIDILGSTMGSDLDFENMLKFVNKHKIVPVVDSVFSMDDAPKAFEKMDKGKQFGKIVLKIK